MRVDMESFDIISFDIFDTLLLRPLLRPRDLWLMIGGEEFARDRARADRGGFETLDDAYALLPQKWQDMKNVELKCERECLVVNPEMRDLWQMAGSMGKMRVIVSDMYLPGGFLQTILRENGIDGWDGFYVSCERKARKSDGGLYRIMLAEMNADPQKVLHIGDNIRSDYEEAIKVGIHAHQYENAIDNFMKHNEYIQRFLDINDTLQARNLVGALSVAWHVFTSSHDNWNGWSRIGGLLGGVFGAAYMGMVAKTAKEKKLDHLLFVARDGYSLEKIFNFIAPQITTSYVYAPRYVRSGSSPLAMEKYKQYVNSLGILAKNIAIVDTVSKSFTSQTLFSSALGKDVFGFYAVALAEVRNGECFLLSKHGNLVWPNLLELLYMAPTPPVMFVENGKPVYLSPVPPEEQFRIDIYPSISEAEIEVAKQLLRSNVVISPEMWLDYVDCFLKYINNEDQRRISSVKNGDDISHTHYVPLLKKGKPKCVWHFKKKIPYKMHTFHRRGLKMIRTDYLFGFIKIREKEEGL